MSTDVCLSTPGEQHSRNQVYHPESGCAAWRGGMCVRVCVLVLVRAHGITPPPSRSQRGGMPQPITALGAGRSAPSPELKHWLPCRGGGLVVATRPSGGSGLQPTSIFHRIPVMSSSIQRQSTGIIAAGRPNNRLWGGPNELSCP